MPELPDLLHIQHCLNENVVGRTIHGVLLKQPVVLRVAVDSPFAEAIMGQRVDAVHVHGPFLVFRLSREVELVINLMLAGYLQLQRTSEKSPGHLCIAFALDDGATLNVCDEQKMAKVYLVPTGMYTAIPRFAAQGLRVFSSDFTLDAFHRLARLHGRKQVRVFINDQTILSAIGNAYADEILFEARLHPKTFVRSLQPAEIDTLFRAIKSVLEWGTKHVRAACQPMHIKVRDHLRVRNRKGEPCPRCGTTIRREGVRGYDTFFCPTCQPATRKVFINWNNHPSS